MPPSRTLTLNATEAPDLLAAVLAVEAAPVSLVLSAVESADVFTGSADAIAAAILAATESPDTFAGTISSLESLSAALAVTEVADTISAELGVPVAIVLQSGTRNNPAPCQHYTVTLNIDGARTIDVPIQASDLNTPITDDDVVAVLKLWARYRRSKGQTLPQMVGGTIFSEVG